MFLPLLAYDGERGDLLAAVLRPGAVHASRGVGGALRSAAVARRLAGTEFERAQFDAIRLKTWSSFAGRRVT